MPLTTAQQVRLRISDRLRHADEVRHGDGSASAFKLAQGAPFSVLNSGASAFVPTTAGWSGTGATFETALGLVTFSSVISANSGWMVGYQWSVFGEEEIGYFTAVGGSVNGAALEAVRSLMFDSLRRTTWWAADGSKYDDTKAMEQLRALYDQLIDEEERAPAGGIESWSEQQQFYDGLYGNG